MPQTAAAKVARLMIRLMLLAFVIVAAAPLQAASLQGTGVVFLHGKGVWPGAFDGGIPGALEAEGAQVESPEMPWSFRRMYGATFDQAMTEIDAAVAGLKARGANRIVIVGHSLGANAAIGYAARRSVVAAVVAIAPGHLPETAEMRARTHDALAEARQMYAAGKQDRRAWPDLVQGIPTIALATPAVYLSMFDPERAGGDPQECRGATCDSVSMGGGQQRPDPRARPRLCVHARRQESGQSLYRGRGRPSHHGVAGACAGRRMAEGIVGARAAGGAVHGFR